MLTRPRLRTLLLLLLAVDVSAKKKKAKTPEFVEVPEDAPIGGSELDAMAKVAGSEKMEGMKFGKREMAPDGKSGRIFLEPENDKPEQWNPETMMRIDQLRKLVDREDVVLAYFMSSKEENLRMSADNGKLFDKAARTLLEDENEVPLAMIDIEKVLPTEQQLLAEYGVRNPHTFKLFVNGRPSNYRGPTSSDGIVSFMKERTGPPTIKIETSAALDAFVANATWTTVIGIFGPAYQGASSRELFVEAARSLRDTGRLSFVDVSTRVATNAKIFLAESRAFDTSTSELAVVRSAKWLGKSETKYHTTTDFRKMTAFINEHSWTTISGFSEVLVSRMTGVVAGRQSPLLVSVLLDTRKHASKLRYVTKRYWKLVDALSPDVRARFTFCIAWRARQGEKGYIEQWLDKRFDRTTIDRTFFSNEKFADEFVQDFTVIVSDPRSDENWVSNAEAGNAPESVKLEELVPFLTAVANGEAQPLAQGDKAAAAAGLKEMSLGFGPNGESVQKITGEDDDKPKRRKKKKAKTAATEEKSEL